jgi:hypothetical protein
MLAQRLLCTQIESAKLRQQQQGLEGMFASFREGVERALADEARRTARDGQRVLDLARGVMSSAADGARLLTDVREELEDEGAPEDTPAGGRRGVPRDPVSAAAAAAAALDALRAKAAAAAVQQGTQPSSGSGLGSAPPPPAAAQEEEQPEQQQQELPLEPPTPADPAQTQAQAEGRVDELADEINVVSARLVAMQERMNKLLSDNNKLLAELESVNSEPSDGDGAAASASEVDDEDADGRQGRAAVLQRSEAVAAAAAAMAAAAKVAAASAAVAAATDGARARRTADE